MDFSCTGCSHFSRMPKWWMHLNEICLTRSLGGTLGPDSKGYVCMTSEGMQVSPRMACMYDSGVHVRMELDGMYI